MKPLLWLAMLAALAAFFVSGIASALGLFPTVPGFALTIVSLAGAALAAAQIDTARD